MKLTRAQWISKRVELYASNLCTSFWHDEAHSWHSTCPQCDNNFSRKDLIANERNRLTHFALEAEKYAKAIGWVKPIAEKLKY